MKYVDMLSSYLPDCIARQVVKNINNNNNNNNQNMQQQQTNNIPSSTRFETSVLFADVSGFTKLSESMNNKYGDRGAEMVAKHLNTYFTELVNFIQEQGGDVFKFAGDALIVLWPRIIFDDNNKKTRRETLTNMARRAAQAGLQIQNKLHNKEMAPGVFLSVKCGIGVGDVSIITIGGIYGRLEAAPLGEPLVQAFASEHHAVSGEVWVSPNTWGLISPYFIKEKVMPDKFVLLKNKMLEKNKLPTNRLKRIYIGGFLQNEFNNMAINKKRHNKYHTRQLSITSSTKHAAANVVRSYVPGAVLPILQLGVNVINPTACVELEGWGGNELREVTIMFVNLGLKEHDLLAASAYNDAVLHVHNVLRSVQKTIYHYEGSINKFLMDDKGSTLIAVFGLLPLVHEDDATRAILASLLLCKELGKFRIQPSIGITTGTAFCGIAGSPNRKEYTVLGDVVNLAARLMQNVMSKGNGGILCSDITYKQLPKSIQCNCIDKKYIKVKGKSTKIHIYQPHGDIDHKRFVADDSSMQSNADGTFDRIRSSTKNFNFDDSLIDNSSFKKGDNNNNMKKQLQQQQGESDDEDDNMDDTPFYIFFRQAFKQQMKQLNAWRQKRLFVFPPTKQVLSIEKSSNEIDEDDSNNNSNNNNNNDGVRKTTTEMIAQKIKRRFSMFMGEDDVDVGKDNKFSTEETRFSITHNMVNPLLNEQNQDDDIVTYHDNNNNNNNTSMNNNKRMFYKLADNNPNMLNDLISRIYINDVSIGTHLMKHNNMKCFHFNDIYDIGYDIVDDDKDNNTIRKSYYKLILRDTYFALPNTNLSIQWLPGFITFAANNNVQTLNNKKYQIHFTFVNTSSITNRLPSSFDCTIKTLERIGQLYDHNHGGCILINGSRGCGKSYFLRRIIYYCKQRREGKLDTIPHVTSKNISNTTTNVNIIAVGMSAYERGNKFILFQRIIINLYNFIYAKKLKQKHNNNRTGEKDKTKMRTSKQQSRDQMRKQMIDDIIDILSHKTEFTPYAKAKYIENIVINGKYTDVNNDDVLVFKIILHIIQVKIKTSFHKNPIIICIDDLQYMHPLGYLMLNHLIASKEGNGKKTESSPSSQKNNPSSRRKSKSPVSSLSPSAQNNNNPSSMMMKTKLPVLFICTLESMSKSRDMVIQPYIPQHYTNFIHRINVSNYKIDLMMPHMLKKIVTDLIDCVSISKLVWDFYEIYSLGNPTMVIEITKVFVEKNYFETVKGVLYWSGTSSNNNNNSSSNTLDVKRVDSSNSIKNSSSSDVRKLEKTIGMDLNSNNRSISSGNIINASKETVEDKLTLCFNTSSWIKGTRYMRLDRLHVLQQQVLKMASGVANIKRSNKKFNSLGLSGYFFSIDHLQAACPIDSLIDDLEGVCDSLEETGVLCKAIDFRTKSVSFTFTDAFVCLAARSRCTMEVQMLLQEQVILLEDKREADQRKRFIEKAIGNINLNEIIEAEILKSKNAKIQKMRKGFASGFNKGWVGATNLNWKTRYVKISKELNNFHICKQNINTFDSNDIKYEVVQTCDVLNMKVYRINKFQYEKHSIPKNTTRCPLKIVTSKWSKKGKMFNEPREIILTLPDPSTAEKIIYLIEGAQHKIFDKNVAMKSGNSSSNNSSSRTRNGSFRFSHGGGKANPMMAKQKQEQQQGHSQSKPVPNLEKKLSARKMKIKKNNSRRLSLLDMEDYIDMTVIYDDEEEDNNDDNENSSSDEDDFNENKLDRVHRLSKIVSTRSMDASSSSSSDDNYHYTIHLNILDVINLQSSTLYSSNCVTSSSCLYCVVHLDNGNGENNNNNVMMKRLNIGKRINNGDISTSRAFTAVTSTNEWNVNIYFRMQHSQNNNNNNNNNNSTLIKGLHGRIWERDFFGDDELKGSFYIPFSMFEKEQIVCKQFSEVDDLEQNQIFSVNLTTRNGIKLEDNARIQFKCNIIGNPPNALFHRHDGDDDDNGTDDENDWIQRYTLYHEGPIPMKEKYMSFNETIVNVLESVENDNNNNNVLINTLNLLLSLSNDGDDNNNEKKASIPKKQESISSFRGSKLLRRLRSKRWSSSSPTSSPSSSSTSTSKSNVDVAKKKKTIKKNIIVDNNNINNIDANDEQIRHDVLNEFNTFCTEMQSITDKYGIDGGDKKDWVRKYMRMRKDAMERNGLEKQFVLHSVYSVGKHLV